MSVVYGYTDAYLPILADVNHRSEMRVVALTKFDDKKTLGGVINGVTIDKIPITRLWKDPDKAHKVRRKELLVLL